MEKNIIKLHEGLPTPCSPRATWHTPTTSTAPEMQRQVRATTYLMGVARRCFADHVQERMN